MLIIVWSPCQHPSYTLYKYLPLTQQLMKGVSIIVHVAILDSPRDEPRIAFILVMTVSQFAVFVISK